MRGNEKFQKFRSFLKLLTALFSITPTAMRRFCWDISSQFSGAISLAIRYSILKSLSASCGENVYIGKNVTIKGFENLKVGNNVSLHCSCYIDASGGISIGNDVSIAHQSTIMSFNHTWDIAELPIKYNPVVYKEVVIEDDVWIGCAVRIMPGVTIHKRSVVAAGAVVTSDSESNTLAGGVPAKTIKRLSNQ